MSNEYDDFFDGVGGGAPSFKFGDVGSFVRGTILDQFKQQQTDYADKNKKLFFDDGVTPRMQLAVTLQTELRNWEKCAKIPKDEQGNDKPASEDDGKRRIYIKSDMQRAVGQAIQASPQQKGGLKNGGTLAVKLSGHKDVGKGNPLSLFEAKYEPPAAGDGFFDGGAQQAPPAQQSAPPTTTAAAPSQTWDSEPPF